MTTNKGDIITALVSLMNMLEKHYHSFSDKPEGYRYGIRNTKGLKFSEFCDANDLTFFAILTSEHQTT